MLIAQITLSVLNLLMLGVVMCSLRVIYDRITRPNATTFSLDDVHAFQARQAAAGKVSPAPMPFTADVLQSFTVGDVATKEMAKVVGRRGPK
ncbi:hypothetical protein [Variovorax sp. RB3P1]|uniref:hypothetical protein n=1 Tax=Variovorax sp. RB3P1 TaxID=3443732 RepID=UPI003F49A66E